MGIEVQSLTQGSAIAELSSLLKGTTSEEELARRITDPALLEALAAWGRSPDIKGDRGPDGRGFNAGVIHYFQYRASRSHARRYKEQEPPTIQGFIDFTDRIKMLINSPENADVREYTLIQDDEGRERLLLLTHEGLFTVGFKNLDDDGIKIISVMAGEKPSQFAKVVEHELESFPESDKRLNRLGGRRRLVGPSAQ